MSKMQKIENELVSEYTSSKLGDLILLRKTLQEKIDEFGVKWRTHLPVFLGPSEVARILWFDFLVKKTLEVPGVVVEFGSQFGASLSVINNLYQIHDAWNASRRIYSFSTFEEGFIDSDKRVDGPLVNEGDYSTPAGWLEVLKDILRINSLNSPIGENIRIIHGDATETFEKFIRDEQSTIIAFAHFDMDIYKPTKKVLEICLSRMPKGSIIVFDELNHPGFPGETIALEEVVGIKNLELRKSPFQPYSAYAVI